LFCFTEPAAVFLRTAAPLSLDAPDGRPVQLFLCLLIPENDDGMYLKILREAACLFGNKPLRNALLHAESEVKICELIHNWTPPADLHYEPDFSEDDEDA
jgi:PTS system nitrogen regulatory IIA component